MSVSVYTNITQNQEAKSRHTCILRLMEMPNHPRNQYSTFYSNRYVTVLIIPNNVTDATHDTDLQTDRP